MGMKSRHYMLLAIAEWAFPPLLLTLAVLRPGTAAPASCEGLKSLSLQDTTITQAAPVAAGAFTSPTEAAGSFDRLPPFCRVSGTIKPTSDSDIKFEVWLPLSGWNSKFQAVGNGGWAGSISYGALAAAVQRGYAASSTDTGHTTPGGEFAMGHPEKLVDYAYRSEHEMSVKAKAIVAAYYGQDPKLSYWNGCSSGGRQAMKEAQNYPQDFDGIIAGAPALNWTGRAMQAVWIAQTVHKDPASELSRDKLAVIHKAVLAACDSLDGVKDGILENPRLCKFDPSVLACKTGSDESTCLTPPQIESVRKIYSDVTNPRTKQLIFPAHEPGSELGWTTMAGPKLFANASEYFSYVVFSDPKWDYKTFDFDKDSSLTNKADNGTIDAQNPNLKPFFDRGGKLIQYHGWSDPQISPRSSVNYYEKVRSTLGSSKLGDQYRLFMVPGMAHCGNGEGPNHFDMVSALENWVENGKPPEFIIASREKAGKVDRTRPLCPYPQVAVYKGEGSIDEASSFTCQAR